jgi:hypothetical protein
MPLRFKLLSSLFVIFLLMATDSNNRPFNDVVDVFAGLAVFLVLSLASVMPNWSRTDRVDRALDGGSWADRIDIEGAARDPKAGPRR